MSYIYFTLFPCTIKKILYSVITKIKTCRNVSNSKLVIITNQISNRTFDYLNSIFNTWENNIRKLILEISCLLFGFYKDKYNIEISKKKSGEKMKSLLDFYYQNKITFQGCLYFKIIMWFKIMILMILCLRNFLPSSDFNLRFQSLTFMRNKIFAKN